MPLWIWNANDEQGDFSNLESRHEYQNGNITDASNAEAESLDEGDEVVWVDEPVDLNQPVNVSPGDRFNLWESEQDSQGVDYPKGGC